jgi:antagonist of KipI
LILVEEAGAFTTVQDLGRRGFQDQGMPVGGAADDYALRLANLLVGNVENAAGLECTLNGPRLRFHKAAIVAVAGATVRGIPMARPWRMETGEILDLSIFESGCRAYLAIAGGIDVPLVMGSRSTYAPATIGGFCGRALQAGDELRIASGGRKGIRKGLALETANETQSNKVVRLIRGPQWGWFDHDAHAQFLRETFEISAQSNRMGVRLAGVPLRLRENRELISEATALGTIQVPHDGQPIVLLADRPTIGGYPKIATVIAADLGRVAQACPWDRVRFREVSLEDAERLFWRREQTLAWLRSGRIAKAR